MFVYILLFLFSCVVGGLYSIKNNVLYIVGLTIPLVLVMGLRGDSVGIDTHQYLYNFIKANDGDYNKSPMFYYVSRGVELFNLEVNSVFVIFAFITISPLFYVIYKEKASPLFAVIILFSIGLYFRYFNIMIQGAAISLYFLAFHEKQNKNRIKTMVFCFLAVVTHLSAVVLIPFLFINRLKNASLLIFMLWIFSLLYFVSPYFLSVTIVFANLFIPDAYSIYLSDVFIKEGSIFSLENITTQILFLITFSTYFKNENINTERWNSYLLMFLFGLILSNILNSAVFFDRILLYFSIFGILTVNFSLISFFSGKQLRVVQLFFFIFFAVIFFYRLIQDPYAIIPYSVY